MTTPTRLRPALRALVDGRDLTEDEAAEVMSALVAGEFTGSQFGALGTALRMKGERAEEIAGFLRVLRAEGTTVDLGELADRAVDTCGTGGDGPSARVFNISTTAAFLVAAAGVPVAKHGTSAVSSNSGSSDVLAELGVRAVSDPADVAACLRELGICFMHAPAFNSGMRHLIGLRQEVGLRFVFNLLGPLCNPARVTRQVTGMYDSRYAEVTAGALARSGTRHAWVVHAEDGLDEVSTTAPTRILQVRDGAVTELRVDAVDLGLARATIDQVEGGDPRRNAEISRAVLAGTATTAQTEIVLLNAAAVLVVAGRAADLSDGLKVAESVLRDGSAQDVLHRWADRSRRTGAAA
ncbi:anthranilate phosphoribosyltransferase [Catellatospora sp. TT07R-123]|uniref:anthranilate phosphoribosyltransferase n=1 Tax=Catellatospora sp. TT07R-123 TaxID=2733863 RepID=UPI001B279BA3|nr:anthranilate phosphoribosyltransferase [Catellatospora sp. TT07R-123]GHJ47530.1 anthranilate phosphoribosyltransferase [Catellatospora sp. TT07R-123]